QLLAVLRGGALVQHLPDVVGNDLHVPSPGTYGDNDVRIAPGSRLAELIGTEATWACHHHQAVDALGAGLTPVAWAADGTIEGAADPQRAVGGVGQQGGDRLPGVVLVGADDAGRAALDPAGDVLARRRRPVAQDPARLVGDRAGALVDRQPGQRHAPVAHRAD